MKGGTAWYLPGTHGPLISQAQGSELASPVAGSGRLTLDLASPPLKALLP